MTLIANSKASLLVGLNNSKNQPAVPNSTGAGPSTFSLALDDTDSDLGFQTDLGDMVSNSKSTLGTAVLELDDASKDNHAAPVADAVWLANWFQNNAPATASSPVPPLGSSSAPVEPVRVGTASKPLTMRSSEPISRADVPISDNEFNDFENDRGTAVSPGSAQNRLGPHVGRNLAQQTLGAEVVHSDQSPVALGTSNWVVPVWAETASKPVTRPSSELSAPIDVTISDQSKKIPSALPDKPASALATASAKTPLTAAVSLPLPTPSTSQAIFQPTAQTSTQYVAQFASIGVGFWNNRSIKNLPSDSGHLRPVEAQSKATMDIVGSVKLVDSVGLNELNDFKNDRGTAVSPGSAQNRLGPHVGLNLAQQTLGAEVVHSDQSPVALWTSNWVVPVWAETASKPVARPSSELSAPIDVTISDQSKKSTSVLPDKPASALAPASATTPLTAAVILPLPTPSTSQAIFQSAAQPAIQPVAQFASIGVGLLDNKSIKNLPSDSGHLRPVEALSKATIDIVGSVKLGQSDGFKDFKDFESDRGLTVTLGSSQISLDFHAGSNLPQQVVGTDAVPPAFNQDAQWTSNLADTVNQWVERSLQLAELTVPDAGKDSLQVRIELNGQEATVYFLTDHVQYREAIESQIENLSDRLADQGLKLAGSFVGQGSSHNSPQEQSAHSMLSRRHEAEPASAKALSIDPVLRDLKSVHQGRVLDVFA